MKKTIFIGFLAVILMIPATVLTVGAADTGPFIMAGDENPAVSVETPEKPSGVAYNDLWYYTITPCRAGDSRISPGVPMVGTIYFNAQAWCGASVPTYAKAYMANFTVTGMSGSGYISAWAYGDANPGTSILNYGVVSGLPAICNAAIVPVNPSYTSEMTIYIYRYTHLIIDIMGYFW